MTCLCWLLLSSRTLAAFTERYVRSDAAGSGDGTTNTNSGANGAFTLAEAITNSATNTNVRYNVRAGTYANGATTRTFNGVGTTTAPNWWRGFNSTIGDLDADFTTAKPSITFSTGQFIVTGAYQTFSNLSILGTANTNIVVDLQAASRMVRCRIENQGTAAGSRAVSCTTVGISTLQACWLKSASTSTSVFYNTVSAEVLGCTFVGGGYGMACDAQIVAYKNVFNDVGGDGIRFVSSNNSCVIIGNTFYSVGGASIYFVGLPATSQDRTIADNVFANSSTYDINNASGANTSIVSRFNNLSYSPGTANANGFSDLPGFFLQTDSSSPFVTPGTDLTPITGSNSRNNGMPGLFENQSYTSYQDIGAVQHAGSAASASSSVGIAQ